MSANFSGTYGHSAKISKPKPKPAANKQRPIVSNSSRATPASKPAAVKSGAYLDDIFGAYKDGSKTQQPRTTLGKKSLAKPSTAPARPSSTLTLAMPGHRTKSERPKSQIAALRKPKTFVPPSQRPGVKPIRESLTDQLAKIGANAGDFTSELRKKHGLEEQTGRNGVGVLKSSPTNKFTVGRLDCKYPSPVTFHADCARYTFHHPHSNSEVMMSMFYTDLKRAQVVGRTFRFKIDHALSQFGDDYDHRNHSHYVAMDMSTGGDAEWVKANIIPRCSGRKR